MNDLYFDLSRSLKVKVDGAIGKQIYDFLLVDYYNNMLICIGSNTFKIGDLLSTVIGFKKLSDSFFCNLPKTPQNGHFQPKHGHQSKTID